MFEVIPTYVIECFNISTFSYNTYTSLHFTLHQEFVIKDYEILDHTYYEMLRCILPPQTHKE